MCSNSRCTCALTHHHIAQLMQRRQAAAFSTSSNRRCHRQQRTAAGSLTAGRAAAGGGAPLRRGAAGAAAGRLLACGGARQRGRPAGGCGAGVQRPRRRLLLPLLLRARLLRLLRVGGLGRLGLLLEVLHAAPRALLRYCDSRATLSGSAHHATCWARATRRSRPCVLPLKTSRWHDPVPASSGPGCSMQ